ncbi:MAG: glutaredoxin domain-containing protein [Candidatus Woesearchaeota archaeon]
MNKPLNNNLKNQISQITITIYKWEGSFFPFTIKQQCGECSLSLRVIKHIIEQVEKEGIEIKLIEKPWLNNWFKVLLKGAWHAPIIFVNNTLVSQGDVISQEQLLHTIYNEYFKEFTLDEEENYIFIIPNCPYCKKAKELLKTHDISFNELDVIENSNNMRKLLKLVQGRIHPITLPQIFLEGRWIKGYNALKELEERGKL